MSLNCPILSLNYYKKSTAFAKLISTTLHEKPVRGKKETRLDLELK